MIVFLAGPLPLLDKIVYSLVGDEILWLGKRAVDRNDQVFVDAMVGALRAGHVPGALKSHDRKW